MTYAIGQRTQEIGVRVAMGAQRRTIPWMVSRQWLAILGAGQAGNWPSHCVRRCTPRRQIFDRRGTHASADISGGVPDPVPHRLGGMLCPSSESYADRTNYRAALRIACLRVGTVPSPHLSARRVEANVRHLLCALGPNAHSYRGPFLPVTGVTDADTGRALLNAARKGPG
jgi:hypothetical protein